MLVIIEEANEIPPSLWTEATTAVVSGGVSHVLAILNPTDTGTPAHQATESGAWVVVPIGVDDTPNFTGEVVSAAARNALPTRAWAEEQQRALTPGEYRARVLGEWPERSEYALIEPEWIDTAMAREAPKEDQNGNDGGASTQAAVETQAQSWSVKVQLSDGSTFLVTSDSAATASRLAIHCNRYGMLEVDSITVDTFGVGADHAVHLAALGKRVTSINSGDRQKLTAAQAKIYDNPRAVWAWSLRKLMQEAPSRSQRPRRAAPADRAAPEAARRREAGPRAEGGHGRAAGAVAGRSRRHPAELPRSGRRRGESGRNSSCGGRW